MEIFNTIARLEHAEFIKNDLKERGEIILSDITFMGALYRVKVRKDKNKHPKIVMYSAAENVLAGLEKYYE